MKRTHFSSILMVFILGINATINAQSIKVKVQNITQRQGVIHVGLCNSSEDFTEGKDTFKELTTKVGPTGEIEVVFNSIPKGKYAIRLYQDTDNSGDLTTNIIGIPKEPFGFSNNPRTQFGPPTFSDASFDLKSDIILTVNLKQINL